MPVEYAVKLKTRINPQFKQFRQSRITLNVCSTRRGKAFKVVNHSQAQQNMQSSRTLTLIHSETRNLVHDKLSGLVVSSISPDFTYKRMQSLCFQPTHFRNLQICAFATLIKLVQLLVYQSKFENGLDVKWSLEKGRCHDRWS